MSQVDFETARQRNLGFGLTYGSGVRSVHAPHWEATLGDMAAQSRMAFPSQNLQDYLDGSDYNQHSRLFVETALQGEGRSMASSTRLWQADDYTPQLGRTQIAQETGYSSFKNADTMMEQQKEVMIVAVVVLGLLSFFYISNH